ncbi:hypothetical protein PsYK624_126700 [Phanerochaete sordida]|uniref:Reverse transcriptase domain-containing protein n=1 Tax=Phanerochaete sordida TaxID=48140 RepID=A0A9P3GK90_9APHY|nr:hypothetical protein PsYK624_126700 [Phanerochaete sordida]
MLRKGNSRPSPGPDLWEKWCTKSLSDTSLALVLDLVNYEIVHSHFPASVKPATMSTIFKRGSRTDLSNYRGITCSNLMKNLPFAWLNHNLVPYLAEHDILPQSQIATQPGVQARDLTSFLAQAETYARRHKQPLYMLRRDQRKGFDRLEPDGFYDAVRAYGLPSSLIDLDRSAQADVPYQVKTIFGLTPVFTVSGVTQQGGPFSPLKSTLTTSMANHWIHDILPVDHRFIFRTSLAHAGRPHTPTDSTQLHTQMVEAMDDSIILTPSLPAAKASGLHAERFQAAYGWETNWPKSLLAVVGVPRPPDSVQMPSVNLADPDSPHLVYHTLAVSASHCEFLRTAVNDPTAQYQKIRKMILDFEFPHLPTRLPFTALRRVMSQCLVSRIRPLLSHQPVSRAHASALDRLLATRIHDMLHFPFPFNSSLLFLPLAHLGFDFPSIEHINDAAALDGLTRDLNHHVPTFRAIARITLADWTCTLNNCLHPLGGPSARSFSRSAHLIPSAWTIAVDVLRVHGLSIRPTDLSHLSSGRVALRHVVRTQPAPPVSPSSLAITNLERAGITQLCDVASWPARPCADATLRPHAVVPPALLGKSAFREWPLVSRWLSTLSLSNLTSAFLGCSPGFSVAVFGSLDSDDAVRVPEPSVDEHAMRAANRLDNADPTREGSLSGDDAARAGSLSNVVVARDGSLSSALAARIPFDTWSLALPRADRQTLAENLILAGLRTFSRPALHPSYTNFLASDASALLPPRSPDVTFAATSALGSTVLSLLSPTASSLHGEVLGLISAALLNLRLPADPLPRTIYTDHLNSVHFVSSRLVFHSPRLPPPTSPASPLYSWLLNILRRSPTPPVIEYTRAHTSSSSLPASLNRFVDYLASSSHLSPSLVLPYPTFTLPDYSLYCSDNGFVANTASSYLRTRAHARITSDASFRPNTTLFRHLYDSHEPPSHPYTRASSSYSAVVQLYARSAQLDTRLTRSVRFGDSSPSCHFGCDADETAHHIFVVCPFFTHLRTLAARELFDSTARLLDDVPLQLRANILRVTRLLLHDEPSVWPQYSSHYYLGTLPSLSSLQHASAHPRTIARVIHCWHYACIRLAARIWGSYKRRISSRTPRADAPIALPPHLSHLS